MSLIRENIKFERYQDPKNAMNTGMMGQIRQFMENEIDEYADDDDATTDNVNVLLDYCVSYHKFNFADYLIEQGANINYLPLKFFYLACKDDDHEVVKYLIEKKYNNSYIHYDNDKGFRIAVANNCLNVAKLLLKNEANVNNLQEKNIATILSNNYFEMVKFLLDAGLDLARIKNLEYAEKGGKEMTELIYSEIKKKTKRKVRKFFGLKEGVNFERTKNPKASMNIGIEDVWKTLPRGTIIRVKKNFGTSYDHQLEKGEYRFYNKNQDYKIHTIYIYEDGTIGIDADALDKTENAFWAWGTPKQFSEVFDIVNNESIKFERKLDPKKAMDIGHYRSYKVGDRVALLPNKEEGWKYEEGTIEEIDPDQSHPRMAIVRLDKKFRKKPSQDMHRETVEVEIDDEFIKHLDESIHFERSQDPKKSMNTGLYGKWSTLPIGTKLKIKETFSINKVHLMAESGTILRTFYKDDYLEIKNILLHPELITFDYFYYTRISETDWIKEKENWFVGTPEQLEKYLQVVENIGESNFERNLDPKDSMQTGDIEHRRRESIKQELINAIQKEFPKTKLKISEERRKKNEKLDLDDYTKNDRILITWKYRFINFFIEILFNIEDPLFDRFEDHINVGYYRKKRRKVLPRSSIKMAIGLVKHWTRPEVYRDIMGISENK